jgi:hypothetical protein
MAAPRLTPQQQADLATLAYNLGHNPETRKDLAKLVKKIDPQRAARSFADVDQVDKLEAFRTEIEEKLDLKGAKAAKDKADEQRAKLAERYDEKRMEAIEAEAARLGTSDLESAAIVYAHRSGETDPSVQPPSPSERPGATWEFPTVAGKDGKQMDFKSFAADPRTHSLNAAYNVITEFKNKSLSPGFRR